jgi:hypothetical protein
MTVVLFAFGFGSSLVTATHVWRRAVGIGAFRVLAGMCPSAVARPIPKHRRTRSSSSLHNKVLSGLSMNGVASAAPKRPSLGGDANNAGRIALR